MFKELVSVEERKLFYKLDNIILTTILKIEEDSNIKKRFALLFRNKVIELYENESIFLSGRSPKVNIDIYSTKENY